MLAAASDDRVPVIAQGDLKAGSSPDGLFVRPTLLGPVPRGNAIARREVFGPVLALLPFRDEADAVALANDTSYGLAAGVWTRDVGSCARLGRSEPVRSS